MLSQPLGISFFSIVFIKYLNKINFKWCNIDSTYNSVYRPSFQGLQDKKSETDCPYSTLTKERMDVHVFYLVLMPLSINEYSRALLLGKGAAYSGLGPPASNNIIKAV